MPEGDPITERLPPVGDPEPTPAARRPGRIACEFCECSLTHTGEVLKFSDRAKAFRMHDHELSTRDERIAALEKDLREVRAQLAELAPRNRALPELLV